MAEPLSQIVDWINLLQPQIHSCLLFADASGPQHIYKLYPESLVVSSIFISAINSVNTLINLAPLFLSCDSDLLCKIGFFERMKSKIDY
jgi:hypothetical protein